MKGLGAYSGAGLGGSLGFGKYSDFSNPFAGKSPPLKKPPEPICEVEVDSKEETHSNASEEDYESKNDNRDLHMATNQLTEEHDNERADGPDHQNESSQSISPAVPSVNSQSNTCITQHKTSTSIITPTLKVSDVDSEDCNDSNCNNKGNEKSTRNISTEKLISLSNSMSSRSVLFHLNPH